MEEMVSGSFVCDVLAKLNQIEPRHEVSIYLYIYLSIYLSICLSVCMSVRPSVRPSVCQSDVPASAKSGPLSARQRNAIRMALVARFYVLTGVLLTRYA